MGEILEAIKGFGGYTTTVSIWVIALLFVYQGLPKIFEAGNKIVDAIANRQSVIEERMRGLLNEADERFRATIAAYEVRLCASEKREKEANDRHHECMEAQDRMHGEIVALRQKVEGFERSAGQRSLSIIRTEGQPMPQMIADAAIRAGEALDRNSRE